jgi:hypothetical protein
VAACSPTPESINELELHLVEGDDCGPTDYAELFSISVTVYGQRSADVHDLCLDAPRCMFVDPLASLADVEDVLAEERQPLVDVDAAGARQVAVHGHRRGCFAYADPGDPPPVMCGFADLASAADGQLRVIVRCACDPPPLSLCE